MEVEVGNLIIELGLSCGNVCSFLVLGNKAKARFAGQTWIPSIGANWRGDPTAACNKASAWVIHDDRGREVRRGIHRTDGVCDSDAAKSITESQRDVEDPRRAECVGACNGSSAQISINTGS